MNSFAAVVAALALVVPAPRAALASAPAPGEARAEPAMSKFGPARPEPDPFRAFRESYQPEAQRQVRIEQHVIIRITPRSRSTRDEMFGPPLRGDDPPRYKEKKIDKCLPIDGIAGIAPGEENRLLLFMRDHQVLSAALERACDPAAFYLGAYVERSTDGKLCAGRDTIRSRTGATCRLSRISKLVAVKEHGDSRRFP